MVLEGDGGLGDGALGAGALGVGGRVLDFLLVLVEDVVDVEVA